jgi:hypothetical protein
MSVELSGYRLEVERQPSDGPVVAVWALCLGNDRFSNAWIEDELPGLLRAAREIAGDRDPDSQMMPDDESLLRACLADLCIEVDDEPADVAALPDLRPVISQDAAHEMLAALRHVVATLSQPVQSCDLTGADARRLEGVVGILRTDCRVTREVCERVIARAEGSR